MIRGVGTLGEGKTMNSLILGVVFFVISGGFACKPYNSNSTSNNSQQPEVRVCQASDSNACLSYQNGAYTQDSLKLSTPTAEQSTTWFLFQNGEYLTLQPTQDPSRSVVLQKAGSDLQQTKLLNPVTQKYLHLQDGQVQWVDGDEKGTDFSFQFLPKADQSNSLR